MMIAFPTCTYLTVTGARWLYNKDKTRNEERWRNREDSLNFVRKLMNADIEKISIENPIGSISTEIRKPDQIIQPWQFGDEAQKATCLWLKNLPCLMPTDIVSKGEMVTTKTGKTFSKWYWETSKAKGKERQILRSKTFPGIAKAMAEQWAGENFLKSIRGGL
jgi:hypothetical protein